MYFTQNPSLHEIEKLMRMIPNFRPRGHGIIVLCGEEDGTASLIEALAGIRHPPFQRRLRQYITESESNPMDYRNKKHRREFENTVRKKNKKNYALFCAAKDLYLGTKYLSVSDLADRELVPPRMFALICNAMAIRRFGLGAIHFTARGDRK